MSLNADDLAQILASLAQPAHLSCTRRDGVLQVESFDEELVLRASDVNAVGIRDIAQVVEHRVNTILGSRSHFLRFGNGGCLQFAYNNAGQLIELSAEGLSLTIKANGEYCFFEET